MLADALKTTFLGDCTRVHLLFSRRTGKKQNGGTLDFQIWAHHGEGGGQLASAPLNKLEYIIKAQEADVYLMAHQHKMATAKVPWLYDIRTKEGFKLAHKNRSMTATGGWLQGYEQGSMDQGRPGGHYPEQKMLTPVSIGGCRIIIEPHHGHDRDWIDHEVII